MLVSHGTAVAPRPGLDLMGPTGTAFVESDSVCRSEPLFACRRYACSSGSLYFRTMRLPLKLRVNIQLEIIYQLGIAINPLSFSLAYPGKRVFSNVGYDGFLRSGKVPLEDPFIAGVIV